MEIKIPELSLVVLIGVSGSGKSTFAHRLFKPAEILSSDAFRALVSNDENDQTATKDAFDALHYLLEKRLSRGLLTVIDATNVQPEARRAYVEYARRYHVLPIALVLDLPARLCQERNQARSDRQFGPHVVHNQNRQLRQSLGKLKTEGFRHIFRLRSPEEVEEAKLVREPLWNNRKQETGPFDLIGDVHGCFNELHQLLSQLGYQIENEAASPYGYSVTPPAGRKAVFLGDLVDRGPRTPDVLRLVMTMVRDGNALCVPGNHDVKLVKALSGKKVQRTHGLQESLDQLAGEPEAFVAEARDFLDNLVSHYVLDGGRLVVAHAGLKENMQGRGSRAVREFCYFGETTGETDEFGLPVRYNWAAEYRGKATVVYGHTPVPQPECFNNTLNIDTGCVFGGRLTALRYPERELVSVPAQRVYAEPARPLLPPEPQRTAQQEQDDQLDVADLLGKQHLVTELVPRIVIGEENAMAALEVMSRFAVDPRWLVYLPPTMSPTETSKRPDRLEHPQEAFAYYQANGIRTVVCEEKHMGSRAVVVVCRSPEAAQKAFGFEEGEAIGTIYTRTGRRFFTEAALEREFLERLQTALTQAGWWESLETDWVVLDCELMPWSAKAQALLQQQYAPVGAAATAAVTATLAALRQAQSRSVGVEALATKAEAQQRMISQYVAAYRQYCWPVKGLEGYQLAPFHVLATEGALHLDKPHTWHMERIHQLCAADPELLKATHYRIIDLDAAEAVAQGIAWWEALVTGGGEGMVIKPLDFIARGNQGLVQPAIKCRGPEYLRIIYGPEYSAAANLERLRSRGIQRKRNLALREFALGVQALKQFVAKAPLREVHRYVFAVLALETEPIDPRL